MHITNNIKLHLAGRTPIVWDAPVPLSTSGRRGSGRSFGIGQSCAHLTIDGVAVPGRFRTNQCTHPLNVADPEAPCPNSLLFSPSPRRPIAPTRLDTLMPRGWDHKRHCARTDIHTGYKATAFLYVDDGCRLQQLPVSDKGQAFLISYPIIWTSWIKPVALVQETGCVQ